MKRIDGGVWPAMVTPFTESGRPRLELINRLVEVFIEEGLDGLYVLGSTGHGPALSLEDRKAVAERVIEANAGRLPVMVHVGCVATADSVELAKHAASVGADAVSSVPPFYYPASREQVFEHYSRIGATTDLPFFPYHHSLFADDAELADPAYCERLLAIPNIAGMKVTVRDMFVLGVLQRATEGRLQLFSGADELICHAVLSGSAGAIGTTYNVWGAACRRARLACEDGDARGAKFFMQALGSAIRRVLHSGTVFGFLRAAMRLKYGLDVGPGRTASTCGPTSLDDREVKELVAQVERASEDLGELR